MTNGPMEKLSKSVIISICWCAGIFVGFLPLLGWHKEPEGDSCFFLNVMHSYYLVFLYFGTIIIPAVVLAAFYAHIYQVVVRQLKQMVIINPEKSSSSKNNPSGGTMVRILGVQQTNEVKATQNLAIIVLFFMICWFPLYTINCIIAFKPDFHVNSNVMLSSIILSHLNSVGNPLLYAYHLRDFRAAMKNFFLVLFNQHHRCEPIIKNYGQPNTRVQKRTSSVSTCNFNNVQNRTLSKVELYVPEKVSNIIKTSAAVAAATTGEANRSIWNITERSISSSDSSKSLDSCHHDKTLIIRPATPYRPRNANDLKSSYEMCHDESDDGFNEEETLPYHDYILGDCDKEVSPNRKSDVPRNPYYCNVKSLSNSSPQLSRGVFFVESGRDSFKTESNYAEPKTVIGVDVSPRKSIILSTLQVINLFKERKSLNRSISDSGHVCGTTSNGVVNSCAS